MGGQRDAEACPENLAVLDPGEPQLPFLWNVLFMERQYFHHCCPKLPPFIPPASVTVPSLHLSEGSEDQNQGYVPGADSTEQTGFLITLAIMGLSFLPPSLPLA